MARANGGRHQISESASFVIIGRSESSEPFMSIYRYNPREISMIFGMVRYGTPRKTQQWDHKERDSIG